MPLLSLAYMHVRVHNHMPYLVPWETVGVSFLVYSGVVDLVLCKGNILVIRVCHLPTLPKYIDNIFHYNKLIYLLWKYSCGKAETFFC